MFNRGLMNKLMKINENRVIAIRVPPKPHE